MNALVNPVTGVNRAFLYIAGFSLVLLTGITVTMIVFVIRYRRSRHPVPLDIRGHTGLEIAWMVIPSIIALSMFYLGWQAYVGLRTVPPGALQIGVTGEMYAWTFTYPNGKEAATEMVVPLGKPVKLNITSRDVIHSLFIPAFRIKMDAVRGLKTYTWFLPERLGTYTIMCAEYCGVGHSAMYADLKVVSPADYERWLVQKPEVAAEKAAGGAATEDLQKLFDEKLFQHIDDKMSFHWRVDGPLLHIRLKAPAAGWLAVGFNPVRGMQGANMIIGYVKDGRVYISDEFGTGLIKHSPDEAIGGRNDVQNAFGTESNGVTEIGFSIPLNSGDAADTVIDPGGVTTVLLAYNTGMDSFRIKHNYRKAFKVNLESGAYKPSQ